MIKFFKEIFCSLFFPKNTLLDAAAEYLERSHKEVAEILSMPPFIKAPEEKSYDE